MRGRKCHDGSIARALALAALCLAGSATAQQQTTTQAQPAPQQPPGEAASLATVATEGVSLAGPGSAADGLAFVGNNGAVTAGDNTVHLKLTRGGSLNICSTTQVHLSTDTAVSGGGLMIALNRGGLEGHYIPGPRSDVILTPDLRLLISGPGTANFSLRVNGQGDTCFDNHGDHAPSVLATNLFEGGAYRIQPNQRVLFEHGSLQQVVDNEHESCGCPPPESAPKAVARLDGPGTSLRSSAQNTAAENPFPLAQSEGLKPPPAPPSTPAVPPGQAQAQVTAPLVYSGEAAAGAGTPSPATSGPHSGDQAATPAAPPEKPRKKHSAFVRFLRKIFG